MKLIVFLAALAAVSMAGSGYFWMITDLHIQRSYKVGGNPANKCTGSGSSAGKFGDYKCDNPIGSAKAIFEFIGSQSSKLGIVPDFLFWGGDVNSLKEPDKDTDANLLVHLNNVTNLLNLVNKTFNGKTKIFPVLGNHDSAPQFKFPANTSITAYAKSYDLWKGYLDAAGKDTLKKGGYYSQVVRPGLRFIGLNTAVYYTGNSKVDANKNTDPHGQLAWLKQTLKNAKSAGEKVLIGSHIAPGMGVTGKGWQMQQVWSDRVLQAMDGYHGNTIIASFYGHSHANSVRILKDISGNRTGSSIAYINPSGTPDTNINPSVILYKYKSEAPFTLMDRYVYHYDLSAANKAKKITWKKLYQVTSHYNVTDMSTKTITKLTAKLNKTSNATWKKFYLNMWSGKPHGALNATGHKRMYCSVLHAYSKDLTACFK